MSLQIGHRKSYDIDLSTPNQIIAEDLTLKLKRHYPHSQFHNLVFGISFYLPIPDTLEDELKIDVMANVNFIRPLF